VTPRDAGTADPGPRRALRITRRTLALRTSIQQVVKWSRSVLTDWVIRSAWRLTSNVARATRLDLAHFWNPCSSTNHRRSGDDVVTRAQRRLVHRARNIGYEPLMM